MEKETWKPDEAWEGEVLERMVEESEEKDLLDLAQDAAIKLAAALGDVRHGLEFEEFEAPKYEAEMLVRKIGRMAVLLDALQLKYGDAVEEEITFLQDIETALE
ncbi:MAG: hypothetical protein IJF02_05520 [Oscillospiraceae bacterium]|nr:hypothetical protein [Oscillospiraceae bacterium]